MIEFHPPVTRAIKGWGMSSVRQKISLVNIWDATDADQFTYTVHQIRAPQKRVPVTPQSPLHHHLFSAIVENADN